ncbi:MAG: hypothetical protein WD940_01970 [Patescibacteria group bacterium]
MDVFEYATVQLMVGEWLQPGVRELSVRTTFYGVDDEEVVRATQTDPLEESLDTGSELSAALFCGFLAPQFARMGQEGWELVSHSFSVDPPFSQALLKRKLSIFGKRSH